MIFDVQDMYLSVGHHLLVIFEEETLNCASDDNGRKRERERQKREEEEEREMGRKEHKSNGVVKV